MIECVKSFSFKHLLPVFHPETLFTQRCFLGTRGLLLALEAFNCFHTRTPVLMLFQNFVLDLFSELFRDFV